MYKRITKCISSISVVFITLSCCNKSNDNATEKTEQKDECFQTLTIKYLPHNPFFSLREERSLDEFLSHRTHDSIVLDATSTVKDFVERVHSVPKMSLQYDSIEVPIICPHEDYIPQWIVEPHGIDVEFVVFITSNDRVDTLGFGRHPSAPIQYNQAYINDSTLYYEMLSMVWSNDSTWRSRFHEPWIPEQISILLTKCNRNVSPIAP